jgi:uncharacterized protein DUF1569
LKTLARERDKVELLDRLKTLRPDSTRRWGQMSAHQMVCHLIDAFHMGIGEKDVSHVAGLLQRTMVKWIALYAPVPWPTAIIRTRPEIDQLVAGTRPIDFADDVARLESVMQRVTARARTVQWQSRHPIFGSMSDADWLRWGYLHVDHHLRQFGA